MKTFMKFLTYAFCFLSVWFFGWNQAPAKAQEGSVQDIPILENWQGEYPVAEFSSLPEDQRRLPVGYLGTMEQFSDVWQVFKPEEMVPEVDFNSHLVLFVRNTVFFNRISIARVLLKNSVAEVLAMETMSALPIEDKVGMALAVIPRAGIRYIKAGDELVPVTEGGDGLAADPLNASYVIEGCRVLLQDGRAEESAGADSATKIRTFVIGTPVESDLDSDGDIDAVLLFGHDPGGSGTFYYLVAALNQEGLYSGTNGVLLGDRIIFQGITIKNGVIIAAYKDRQTTEPMSAEPVLEKRIVLTLENGNLSGSGQVAAEERIVEGRVTIGHEVRSFKPCSQKDEYWLSGDSAALREIMAQYREVMSDERPYTPLFMALAGKFTEPPHDGFGMDFKGAFAANQLLAVLPEGICRNNSIVVDSPISGETITSPLVVRGRARGSWFFEGDFPVILKDITGRIIARGFAAAKSDWMTREFVDFEGVLEFEKPAVYNRAILVFKKDNPSDRPELDDEIEFFVFLQ